MRRLALAAFAAIVAVIGLAPSADAGCFGKGKRAQAQASYGAACYGESQVVSASSCYSSQYQSAQVVAVPRRLAKKLARQATLVQACAPAPVESGSCYSSQGYASYSPPAYSGGPAPSFATYNQNVTYNTAQPQGVLQSTPQPAYASAQSPAPATKSYPQAVPPKAQPPVGQAPPGDPFNPPPINAGAGSPPTLPAPQ